MTMTVPQIAVLIVVSIVALELVKLGTQYFFGRITKDDYVTTTELEKKCRGCQETATNERRSSGTKLDLLCRDMTEMKQILLIVALKNDISPEELRTLVG